MKKDNLIYISKKKLIKKTGKMITSKIVRCKICNNQNLLFTMKKKQDNLSNNKSL